ncbi:MAG: DUF5906 domain-containing protein [Firmicutes bacterium]|nr:DUF5906 domain-containing protein [Bacillota bacterium]
MSYFEQRLNALNITKKRNAIKVKNMDGFSETVPFFTENQKGDILINYFSPAGEIEYYSERNDGRSFKPFQRTRYAEPKNPKQKYFQPKGSEVLPFSTPLIIENYKAKTKIKTLYITEGEFKAFALDNFSLPCFGIGGIHNFKDTEKDKIHPYILDFCKVCQVENIVLLFDADCLKVEWKENTELTTRLNTFYAAVNIFNELLKPHDICLYFAHIEKNSEFKGIDDLLYSSADKQEDVIKELSQLLEGYQTRRYINTWKISGVSVYIVQRIFGLDNVQTFFEQNIDLLRDKEFIYKGDTYYADKNDKLTVSWKGEQNNYLRIGVDYYKKVVEKAPNGQTEINLKKWSIEAIKADYNDSKEFIKRIKKCDSFTNIPENDPAEYKQIIESEKKGIKSILYNRYYPVYHIPERGTWENINTLLHHIFDHKNISGHSLYEFALDYLQILYTQPIKKLPILCLVSKENATGKTTFLNLLRAIFIENMRILDSERISSKFNDSWVGKLVVAIDESLIAMDRDVVKNRIKMIATNQTIPLEGKMKDAGEVPNFSKLIMCSNDESNFMRIDYEENRYCIIKVATIAKEKSDPFLFEKMEKEIPAFLHFLKNRALYYEEKSRLFFDETVYETPALLKVKERTENPQIKHLKDVIKNQFYYQKKDTIKLSLKVIVELVTEQYKHTDKLKINEYLRDRGFKLGNATNFDYCKIFDELQTYSGKDKCYTFKSNEWLDSTELKDFLDEAEK